MTAMRVVFAAVLALSCQLAHAAPPALPPAALAPPGLTPAAEPEEPDQKSYWYQTLGADAVAVTFVALAADTNSDNSAALARFGLATYIAAAPLIHVGHGRPGRALASVTMRIGMPFLGAIVGGQLEPDYKCAPDEIDCGGDGVSGEVVLGVVLGAIGAIAIDATVLADGDAPKAKPQPSWTPTARASQSGVAFGVTGTF